MIPGPDAEDVVKLAEKAEKPLSVLILPIMDQGALVQIGLVLEYEVIVGVGLKLPAVA